MIPAIGIVGKKRTGKTTFADYLASKYGFAHFAFADELKGMVHHNLTANGLDIARLNKGELVKYYQKFGDEFRAADELYFVKKLIKKMLTHLIKNETKGIVVSDCRYVNEAESLKELGFVLIKVESPLWLRIKRMEEAGETIEFDTLKHSSETEVDEIEADFTINNVGSIVESFERLDAILGEIYGKRKTQEESR